MSRWRPHRQRPTTTAAEREGIRSWRFSLLWAGQSVSVLGDGAAALALPLLVLQVTDSPVLAAAVPAARTAAYLLVGMWAGPFVDRLDVRRVMIAADAGRALLFGALVAVVHLPHAAGLIVVGALLIAMLGIVFETALAVAVRDLLPDRHITAGNARLELSSQVGLLVGPAVTGLCIGVLGLTSVLWANALTFAVSVLSIVPLRFSPPDRDRATAGRASVVDELRDGWRFVAGQPLLRRLVLLQFVVNFVIAAETLVVYFASRNLSASPGLTGAVVAASGAGGVVAAALAGRLGGGQPSPRVVGLSVCLLGVALLGIGLSPSAVVLAVANAALGGTAVVASVHIRALRQKITPRHMLGRVTATARTIAYAANPIGAALFGAGTQAAGRDARWSFLVAAALSLMTGGLAYRSLIRAPDDEAPATGSESLAA